MAAQPQRNKSLPKPIDFDQLYPGRFLKSGELLGKKRTVTIDDVEIDELEGEKGKKIQGIIFLKETEKQILLNKTNGLCLRGMFGRKLGDWKGKRITIYQDSVRFGPDMVDAIRIWGSPDIDRDMQVTITLPRKKPVTMTMHKVVPGKEQQPARESASESKPQQQPAERTPFTKDSAIEALKSCATEEQRANTMAAIVDDFDARNEQLPVEIDDANQMAKERLAQLF